MIIHSGVPIEVCEFTEGWEDPLLIGEHFAYVLYGKKGASSEVIQSDTTDTQTLEVVSMIAEEAERDYRTLGYVYANRPTRHGITVRVGDVATGTVLIRNNIMDVRRLIEEGSGIGVQKSETARIGDMPKKPFRFRGRGITHKDGPRKSRDVDSVMYTLTNQDGTLHYRQRFVNPFVYLGGRGVIGDFCELALAAPLLHLQARPGASVKLQDNVMYRTMVNKDIHAPSRPSSGNEKQRVFIKVLSERIIKK